MKKNIKLEKVLEPVPSKRIENITKTSIIEEKNLTEIDLQDSFFDSLKRDYAGFEEWFLKKQKKQTKVFITRKGKVLTSLLMLKEEDEKESYDDFDKKMPPLKRIKIATMKVANPGKNIGAIFMNIIMQKAIQARVDEIYITMFEKQTQLIDFCQRYGFVYYCKKDTKKPDGTIEKENVYIKFMKSKEEDSITKIKNQKIWQ